MKKLIFLTLMLFSTGVSFGNQGTGLTNSDYDQQIIVTRCGNIALTCVTEYTYNCDGDICGFKTVCSSASTKSSEYTSSHVNTITGAYSKSYNDSARVSTLSGCAPCGSGGASQSLPQINLKRYYNSRRAHRVWDLGLGQATSTDIRLTLNEETDGSLTIYKEIPQTGFAPMFLDGRRGDIRDGIFHGAEQNASIEFHLLDANDNLVLNYADAVKIRCIDFEFKTYEYEVISLGGSDYAGRLTSIKDLRGYGVDITTKVFD